MSLPSLKSASLAMQRSKSKTYCLFPNSSGDPIGFRFCGLRMRKTDVGSFCTALDHSEISLGPFALGFFGEPQKGGKPTSTLPDTFFQLCFRFSLQ